MGENLGLFGWPIPEPREKSGRPEHEASDENRNKVMMMLAFGMKTADIALGIGVSQPTLRKHYFRELGERRRASMQLRAQRLHALYHKAIVDRDTAAIKELGREIERNEAARIAQDFGAAPARPPRLGKKEQAAIDAANAGVESDWGADLLPVGTRAN